jgi:hypothetical protein
MPDRFGLTSMQHQFGKRTTARFPHQEAAQPTLPPGKPAASDPTLVRRAVLAVGLTITIVGGMFLLPKLGQCEGGRGALGLDWCRLMKASAEGGARGVAIGRGMAPAGSR